ncbi:pentapeptide repeat-containing protein [Sphingomonas sp. PP-CC-3A-396]|uniref:anti-phage Hailong system effector protein HalA n=1 Tax=Sphingomonas sp. PP-CC-3A-396 TaxID=2135655 RepID=UPI00104C5A86|nr:pentapeptide repeat-containing protein [Sphingomonas sp. PP-CC-3A-396]TCQ05737.1 pentapeptide repeat protein [Sphingomonas sp. PP-CC-3A-396]
MWIWPTKNTPAIIRNNMISVSGGNDAAPSVHIGHRRAVCWWEPIYSPALEIDKAPYDWNATRDAGPANRFISGSSLNSQISPGDTYTVKGKTFKNCDFQGMFSPTPLVMFDECNFINCDFAYSKWQDAHFRKCNFSDSSLSLTAFSGCDFRECKWHNIGISSRIDLNKTYISNPDDLINASVSSRNPKDKTIKHRLNQWFRLKGTRAHFLRTVMISHQSVGDERTYYNTVKLHELRRSTERMSQDIFEIYTEPPLNKITSVLKLALHIINYAIMRAFGWLNGWGESAGRPCIALGACFLLFGSIYSYFPSLKFTGHPFQKSFDITFLVGFTNQGEAVGSDLATIQNVHVLISIAIYSVFFATVISKLSRAR